MLKGDRDMLENYGKQSFKGRHRDVKCNGEALKGNGEVLKDDGEELKGSGGTIVLMILCQFPNECFPVYFFNVLVIDKTKKVDCPCAKSSITFNLKITFCVGIIIDCNLCGHLWFGIACQSKIIFSLLFDLAQMAASWILITMQCLKYIIATPLCRAYPRHQTHESASILFKIIYIYCLTLQKWRQSCICCH